MPHMNSPGYVALGQGCVGEVLFRILVVVLVSSMIPLASEILIANICTVLYSL